MRCCAREEKVARGDPHASSMYLHRRANFLPEIKANNTSRVRPRGRRQRFPARILAREAKSVRNTDMTNRRFPIRKFRSSEYAFIAKSKRLRAVRPHQRLLALSAPHLGQHGRYHALLVHNIAHRSKLPLVKFRRTRRWLRYRDVKSARSRERGHDAGGRKMRLMTSQTSRRHWQRASASARICWKEAGREGVVMAGGGRG